MNEDFAYARNTESGCKFLSILEIREMLKVRSIVKSSNLYLVYFTLHFNLLLIVQHTVFQPHLLSQSMIYLSCELK